MNETETAPLSTGGFADAGGLVLALLARPLNLPILRALGRRPMRLADLLAELDWPAQSTVRGRLAHLTGLGIAVKRGGGMPYAVENELTAKGRDLLCVSESFASWLVRAPGEPISPDGAAARNAIKALAEGWNSTMLRALLDRPHSLGQLNSLIGGLSYPALERRLAAMRAAGLVEPAPDGAYAVSCWGREAAGPLASAVRFERLH